MSKETYEKGLAVRREVLGAEYVERQLATADDFNKPLQDLLTEYCWGGVWGRPQLPRKTRSLLNLAMLSALNRPTEFKTHVRGALKNGCTRDEIREVLLQVAIYCGAPAGVEAFRLAREVLNEADKRG
jgi:4-carboxymuconolactone decarboxylase